MANFTTHIAVGTVIAGGLATVTLAADIVSPQNVVAVTLAGVLGSILPDIDLKDSRASRMMFSGLGVFFSFAVLFNAASKLSIAELWILWLGTLVAIRYGLHAAFHRLSIHRGIWHSVLAAVFASVATAIVFYYLLDRPEGVSWLAGAFLFFGYISHLVLDEIYSVDVMDRRLKASFGTALKAVDQRNWLASSVMAAATVAAIYVSPPTNTFVEGLGTRAIWTGLSERMLPPEKWFGVFDRNSLRHLAGRGEARTTVAPETTTVTLPPQSATGLPPATAAKPGESGVTTGSVER